MSSLTQYNCLEALSVDDGWAGFVVFGLGDPHLLEGGEGREDGSANPDGVLSLWWGNDLDLHGGRGKGSDFLLHTVGDAWEHGGAAGEDGVGVEVLTDVDVALHDGVVGALVDAGLLHAEEGWKRASGQRNRSLPMVMTCPSGSSYDFSRDEELAAVCISWSKSSATYANFSLMSRTISRSAVVVNE